MWEESWSEILNIFIFDIIIPSFFTFAIILNSMAYFENRVQYTAPRRSKIFSTFCHRFVRRMSQHQPDDSWCKPCPADLVKFYEATGRWVGAWHGSLARNMMETSQYWILIMPTVHTSTLLWVGGNPSQDNQYTSDIFMTRTRHSNMSSNQL